jgi:tetratricopeptide (TPR) repeat protein/tRNA A-37 threonylcarbamoyl transferase component Bud32
VRRVLPSGRWAQIETLFQEAAELPAAQREEFLEQNCGDPALRDEVRSLLRYDTNGEGSPWTHALGAEAASIVGGDEAVAGQRIGPYRIEKEIGRGGMAVVYAAMRDDGEFHKRVAIKLIKRGMDTDLVIERLKRERRILAALEHASIARLLDGGTAPDGRPWIAMEYVEGVPIDAYCASNGLTVDERCRLIGRICDAVAYAHRNLVVHRDLKPSNILVAPDGNPKLLDFGIAKLLSVQEGTEQPETRGPARALTPEYASPEQLLGNPAGTPSDVYSLGIVLYELLAGVRPRRTADGEVEKASAAALRAGRTPRWARQLAGDLDTILRMALRPEPERRYLSVDQFKADLDAHLQGLPVSAHEESPLYRVGKFLSRYRLGVLAAGLVILALAGGMAATLWQARRAEAAQHEAERRFGQVRELAGKFLFDFHDSIASLPGSTPARKMMVDTAILYYDSLVKDAAANRDLLQEAARGYDRLGDVEGNPFYSNLGDLERAMSSYRKARALREKIADPSPEFLRDRILGNVRIGQILQAQARYDDSEKMIEQAISWTGDARAQPTVVLEALVTAWGALGTTQIRAGRNEPGLRSRLELMSLSQELARRKQPGSLESKRIVADAESKLGEFYYRNEIPDKTLQHLSAARALELQLVEASPDDAARLRDLRVTDMMLGSLLANFVEELKPKPGEATGFVRDAYRIAERMVAVDPTNRQAIEDFANSCNILGDSLRFENRWDEAVTVWRKGLAAAEQLPSAPRTHGVLSQLYRRLAMFPSHRGNLDAAIEGLGKAETHAIAAEKDSPKATTLALRLADITDTRADFYIAAKRWKEAVREMWVNAKRYDELGDREPGSALFADRRAVIYKKLSFCYLGGGDRTNARKALETALQRFALIEAKVPLTPNQIGSRQDALTRLASLAPPSAH